MGCSCDGVVLWGCSVAAVGVVVAWHWYMRRQFWVSQVSLTGVVLMLLVVVVMCGGVVVVVACVGCVRCVACVGCVGDGNGISSASGAAQPMGLAKQVANRWG